MPRTIRFYFDENVSSAIADSLRRRGIDVTSTPEEGLISAPDEGQLAFAISQERVIFTQDADFLRLNQAGATHTEIAFCRKNSRSIGEIVNGLVLIWELLEPEEMRDRVEFL